MSLQKFINDKAGANLVEYIILVGIVALIAIAGFKIFGQNVKERISAQADTVKSINASAK